MMPANAHTSKKFTRMCFEKSDCSRVWFEISGGLPEQATCEFRC